MLIKRYRVTAIEPELVDMLRVKDHKTSWSIAANDMASAWRKFTVQNFGTLKPNPADYDIALERCGGNVQNERF